MSNQPVVKAKTIPGKLKGKEADIDRMLSQGLSDFQIAITLGVYPNSIRFYRRKRKTERETLAAK